VGRDRLSQPLLTSGSIITPSWYVVDQFFLLLILFGLQELAFVMIVCPLVLNAMQCWFLDWVLKIRDDLQREIGYVTSGESLGSESTPLLRESSKLTSYSAPVTFNTPSKRVSSLEDLLH